MPKDARDADLEQVIRKINDYLNVWGGDVVKVLAMALIIRELFKGRGGAGPGYYVMTPYFMGRLTHWISGGRVLLNEEVINWLAARHDEITERALTLIVNTLMGGITEDYEHLRDVLRPWINHGTVNLGISTRDDAIKYIVGYYGGEVRREFAGLDDKCWGTLVLLLGIVWGGGYAIRDLGGGTANDLMPLVRPAVEFLSDAGRVNECMALKLLMVNNEITPLTEILLVGPVMGYTSPVLDALAEGRSGDVERDLGEFIRVIEDGRERNRGLGLAEGGLYALGLVVLTAYAVKVGLNGYRANNELGTKALRIANWVVRLIQRPSSLTRLVRLLISLRSSSLDDWAALLHNVSAVVDQEGALRELAQYVDGLWKIRRNLSNWGRAFLLMAMANTLRVRTNRCKVFRSILGAIGGLNSEVLSTLVKAHVHLKLTEAGPHCGVDPADRLGGLISKVEGGMRGSVEISNEGLMDFLRRLSTKGFRDTLEYLVDWELVRLYIAMGKISVDKDWLDDALKYLEKSRGISERIGDWWGFIMASSLIARVRLIRASEDINEFINAGKKFEEVYGLAVEKLGPAFTESTTLTRLAIEYAAYLGMTNDGAKASEVMMGVAQSMVKDVFTYAAARLFLNWLGVTSVGRPRAEELVSAVREYVDATFMPA